MKPEHGQRKYILLQVWCPSSMVYYKRTFPIQKNKEQYGRLRNEHGMSASLALFVSVT
jgi:hypothetical protein